MRYGRRRIWYGCSGDLAYDGEMRNESISRPKRKKGWLLSSLITFATIVAMLGLARLSPVVAWTTSAVGLVALLIFFWFAAPSKS